METGSWVMPHYLIAWFIERSGAKPTDERVSAMIHNFKGWAFMRNRRPLDPNPALGTICASRSCCADRNVAVSDCYNPRVKKFDLAAGEMPRAIRHGPLTAATACGVSEKPAMAKSVLRPSELYNTHDQPAKKPGKKEKKGRPGQLGVSKTTFYESFVYDDDKGGEQFIPGTTIPRLKLVNIGPKITVAIEDEVDQLIEALRRERDRRPRVSTDKRDTKIAAEAR